MAFTEEQKELVAIATDLCAAMESLTTAINYLADVTGTNADLENDGGDELILEVELPEEGNVMPITLEGIRERLNAYVKKTSKEDAFALVEKYADGSRNPADIPEERYQEIVEAMG